MWPGLQALAHVGPSVYHTVRSTFRCQQFGECRIGTPHGVMARSVMR